MLGACGLMGLSSQHAKTGHGRSFKLTPLLDNDPTCCAFFQHLTLYNRQLGSRAIGTA